MPNPSPDAAAANPALSRLEPLIGRWIATITWSDAIHKIVGGASGIDMSARMVSLAVNIAVMGFILVSGVSAQLKGALPGLDAAQLHILAEGIAAGDTVSDPGLTLSLLHEALVSGFGRVMLYGGIGVWIMAGIGFNARSVRQAEVQCSD